MFDASDDGSNSNPNNAIYMYILKSPTQKLKLDEVRSHVYKEYMYLVVKGHFKQCESSN